MKILFSIRVIFSEKMKTFSVKGTEKNIEEKSLNLEKKVGFTLATICCLKCNKSEKTYLASFIEESKICNGCNNPYLYNCSCCNRDLDFDTFKTHAFEQREKQEKASKTAKLEEIHTFRLGKRKVKPSEKKLETKKLTKRTRNPKLHEKKGKTSKKELEINKESSANASKPSEDPCSVVKKKRVRKLKAVKSMKDTDLNQNVLEYCPKCNKANKYFPRKSNKCYACNQAVLYLCKNCKLRLKYRKVDVCMDHIRKCKKVKKQCCHDCVCCKLDFDLSQPSEKEGTEKNVENETLAFEEIILETDPIVDEIKPGPSEPAEPEIHEVTSDGEDIAHAIALGSSYIEPNRSIQSTSQDHKVFSKK